MISFSVAINNLDSFKLLLREKDVNNIIAIARADGVYFVYDSIELYMHRFCPYVMKTNLNEDLIFKIDRDRFSKLLVEGFVEFMFEDGQMSLEFKNKDGITLYTYSTKMQADVVDKILHKMELIDRITEYPLIDIDGLALLTKIAKVGVGYSISSETAYRTDKTGIPIAVCDGVATVDLRDTSVCKRVKADDFVVNGRLLDMLRGQSKRVYNVANYLLHYSEDFVMMVTKIIGRPYNELDFILKQKSMFAIKLKLNHMLDLCKKVKFNAGDFILDIDNNKAEFIETSSILKSRYSTTIEIIDIQKSKKKEDDLSLENIDMFSSDVSISLNDLENATKYGIPKFKIPSTVLTSILMKLQSTTELTLFIKKNYILIKLFGCYITFARVDLDD